MTKEERNLLLTIARIMLETDHNSGPDANRRRAVLREAIAALASPAQPLTVDTIDLTNPLPGDPPIQQQPNDAVFRGFRGNNEA